LHGALDTVVAVFAVVVLPFAVVVVALTVVVALAVVVDFGIVVLALVVDVRAATVDAAEAVVAAAVVGSVDGAAVVTGAGRVYDEALEDELLDEHAASATNAVAATSTGTGRMACQAGTYEGGGGKHHAERRGKAPR
jgi:hypothetical protein